MITLYLHEILSHIGKVKIKEQASPNFNKVITRQNKLEASTLFFCLEDQIDYFNQNINARII